MLQNHSEMDVESDKACLLAVTLGHASLKAKFRLLSLQNEKVLNAKNLLSCL